MPIIAPSLLAADFLNLDLAVSQVNESTAEWLHLDIMDGVFVPNISFGFPILEAVRRKSTKLLDVHLMIVNPEKYIENFFNSGAAVITVHLEACNHLNRTITQIKDLGIKAGVAINPHTPVGLLEEILPFVDLVCLMSVNPGFGSQKFINSTYSKIEKLVELKKVTGSSAMIEIDGGVDLSNASKLVGHGANILVSGNSIFGAHNIKDAINLLSQC